MTDAPATGPPAAARSDPDHLGRGPVHERKVEAQGMAAKAHARLERVLGEIADERSWPLTMLRARGLLVMRTVDRSTPAVVVHRRGPSPPAAPVHAPFDHLPDGVPPSVLHPSDVTPLPLDVQTHTLTPSLTFGEDVDPRFEDLDVDSGMEVQWLDRLARTARATQVLDVLRASIDQPVASSVKTGVDAIGAALDEKVREAPAAAVIIGAPVKQETASDWIEALPDGAAVHLAEATVDPRLAKVVGHALLLTSTAGPLVTLTRAWDLTAETVVGDTAIEVTVSERRVLDRRPVAAGSVTATRFTLA